jgi:hypothetical protein
MSVRRRKRSRQVLIVAVIVALMGAVSAIGTLRHTPEIDAAAPDGSDASRHLTIQIRDHSDSGVSGKATLRENGGMTMVNVRMDGDATAYPTHLHEGTCNDFEAMPGVPLADSVPGLTSRTLVEMSLDDLLAGSWVINVHHPEQQLESLLDPASVIACGEITGTPTQDEESSDGDLSGQVKSPNTGVGSTIARHSSTRVTIALSVIAVVICGAGIALRRTEQREWIPYPV